MSMRLHDHLNVIYGCSKDVGSACVCKEIMVEQLIYTLQESDVRYKISDFLLTTECSQLSSGDDRYQPLTNEHPSLPVLHSFLTLCDCMNREVMDFLSEILQTPSNTRDLLRSLYSKTRQEIQSTVFSVVLPPSVRIQMMPLIEAYLSLELESAEAMQQDYNIFSPVLPVSVDERKLSLIQMGRSLGQSHHMLTLSSSYFNAFVSFAKGALFRRIKLICADNYSEHFLDAILTYREKIILNTWLPNIFGQSYAKERLSSQLSTELIYQLFYEARKPDIFSLIIEFPDSVAALLDLGKCLEHISFRQELITHLTQGVKQRLLHPGVHTEQILVAYSYLFRALRLMDKSFLVQDVVCRPVSACLRQREDAVRCIVDKLLYSPETAEDEGDGDVIDACASKTNAGSGQQHTAAPTELYAELLLRKPLEVEPVDGAEDSDAEIVSEDPAFDDEDIVLTSTDHDLRGGLSGWGHNWQPDPVEAMHQVGLWRRRMDLLSMLVSIYGSKKAFLIEYRQLLSQRLLKQRSFHTANELRNLELLKLRFGEDNLVECEVMLKDIRDSKRIANLVSETNEKRGAVNKSPTASSQIATGAVEPTRRSPTAASMDPPGLTVANSTTTTTSVATVTDGLDESHSIFPLFVYILSVHYWPELLSDQFKLPQGLCGTFERYERAFQRLKGNRSLQWLQKLGMVNVTLELGARSMKLDLTPLQASIAHLFTEKSSWNLRDLAQHLETQISNVRHSLLAFVHVGFIRPRDSTNADGQPEIFEVCHPSKSTMGQKAMDQSAGLSRGVGTSGANRQNQSTSDCGANNSWMLLQEEQHDGDEVVSNVRDRKEKELQVFWSYIVAMLTNLGSLSLDRIHSMLRMFALGSATGLEFSRDELRQFLDRKLREAELLFDGESYKLPKADG